MLVPHASKIWTKLNGPKYWKYTKFAFLKTKQNKTKNKTKNKNKQKKKRPNKQNKKKERKKNVF